MSFQMVMSKVLQGLTWKKVLCYIDDILVFSSTLDEHFVHLQEVFDRLAQANLRSIQILHPLIKVYSKEQ
jgi:hypothetical protein